jgi:hypothetical protein
MGNWLQETEKKVKENPVVVGFYECQQWVKSSFMYWY